jgi:hypothetical protein
VGEKGVKRADGNLPEMAKLALDAGAGCWYG